jgi:hypothetical protein
LRNSDKCGARGQVRRCAEQKDTLKHRCTTGDGNQNIKFQNVSVAPMV